MKKFDFSKLLIDGTKYIANLAILNIYWLLFSLPVFTIIPATNAVFSILNQDSPKFKDQTQIMKKFIFFMKKDFWKSYKIGLPIVILLLIISLDFMYLNSMDYTSAVQQIFRYSFYFISIILIILVWYVYPLSKMKDYKLLQLFFHSMILLINYPVNTLKFILFIIFYLIVLSYNPFLSLFFIMSGPASISNLLVRRMVEE